jgi:hypothetical protein
MYLSGFYQVSFNCSHFFKVLERTLYDFPIEFSEIRTGMHFLKYLKCRSGMVMQGFNPSNSGGIDRRILV